MAGTILPTTVKKPKQSQDITKEQVAEYIKCSQDPVYFIEAYVRITSIDIGEIPFDMYYYQKEMVENYYKHRFNINLLSRQSGKTSAVAAFALYHVLFEDRKNVLILALKSVPRSLFSLKKAFKALSRKSFSPVFISTLGVNLKPRYLNDLTYSNSLEFK